MVNSDSENMSSSKEELPEVSALERPTSASDVEGATATSTEDPETFDVPAALVKKLSVLDRLLTPAILICMIVGVLIGNFVSGVQAAFDTARFQSVSAPIAIGLIVMMWPILTKVRYEALPSLLPTLHTLTHVLVSLLLNWIIAPFLMLALAWATLPDLPTYRVGVIMVGLARCIAMVMVWNALAQGDGEYCAILVVLNSLLQIVLYAPFALLFVNILGGGGGIQNTIHVSYGDVAISVLIYLGIPLAAGVMTRFAVIRLAGREFFETRFLLYFSPLALLGLLYTIIVMFAYQGHHIVHNLGPVFRVFVPLILYFVIMWTAAFAFVWWRARRARRQTLTAGEKERAGGTTAWTYEMAVVQSFTVLTCDFVGTGNRSHNRCVRRGFRPGTGGHNWATRGGTRLARVDMGSIVLDGELQQIDSERFDLIRSEDETRLDVAIFHTL
ncbi:sodium bile acid symporter family-domain-containing protein [Cerioporus squamosus]|nr:sodium bile acid symporter family-domain-containing protein [Cerioporus squamosus]